MLEYRAILEDFARYLGVKSEIQEVIHTYDSESGEEEDEYEYRLKTYYLNQPVEICLTGAPWRRAASGLTAEVATKLCIGTTNSPDALAKKYKNRSLEIERDNWPGQGNIEISTEWIGDDESYVNLTITCMILDLRTYHREKLHNFLLRLVLASEILEQDTSLGLNLWGNYGDLEVANLGDIYHVLDEVEQLVSIDGSLYRWSQLNKWDMSSPPSTDSVRGSRNEVFHSGEVTERYIWGNKEVLDRSTVMDRLFDSVATVMNSMGLRYQDDRQIFWMLDEQAAARNWNESIVTQKMIYEEIDQLLKKERGSWFSFREGAEAIDDEGLGA